MSDYEEFVKRMGSFDMDLSLDDVGPNKNELIHYGVLGMKWGVRRRRRAASVNERDAKKLEKSGFKKEADALRLLAKKQRTKADEIEARINKKKEMKKKVEEMSDDELRKVINRLQMERQYSQLSPSNINKGKEYAQKVIRTGITVATATTTALTIYNNVDKIKAILEKKG